MWFIMGKYNGLSCLYIIIMVYNGIQIWFHDDIEHSTCVRITWCKILPNWIVIINYYVLLQTWGIPKSPRVYSILKWSSMTWMIWGNTHFGKLPEIYVPTFERHLPHSSGCRWIALWIGSIDGFWQRKCSNSGRWCGEAGWNTWAMIC